MLVRHIMSTEVFSLAQGTRILEAQNALRSRRIRHAPIVDDANRLIGMVTDRDLLRAVPNSIAEMDSPAGRAALKRSVEQIGTRNVLVARADDHIEEVASVLLEYDIGAMPVVQRGEVVGIVSSSDIFRTVVGSAHLATATRVTAQRKQGPAIKSVQAVVRFLRLELLGLSEYMDQDDREVVVIRVKGERLNDLCPSLTRAGWLVLDRRDPSESDRRAVG